MPKNMGLTAQEMKFIDEYVIDYNQTRAFRAAGYHSKTYGSACVAANKLLKKVNIQDAIRHIEDETAKHLGITKKRILDELAKIAFASMDEIMDWNESGVVYKNASEIPKRVKAAISEIQEITTNAGHNVKFKMHDKRAALDTLLSLYKDDGDDEPNNTYARPESLKAPKAN